MAATVTTKEKFDPSVTKEQIDEEIRLRMKAGAIRCFVDDKEPKWTLCTEWNVIGEQ